MVVKSDGQESAVFVINSYTGEIIDTFTPPGGVTQVVQLADRLHGSGEQYVFLLTPTTIPEADEVDVHIFPDTAAARAHARALAPSVFFWAAQVATGALR